MTTSILQRLSFFQCWRRKPFLDFDGTRDGVQAGDTCTYELDLQKANGNKFLVQVIDYANNVTTYVLKMQLGEEQPVPEMFAFDGKKGCWIGFNRGDTESLPRKSPLETTPFSALRLPMA